MMQPHRQSGVALVTAILLVAIATMLATKLAWDNQVSMRRTETLLNMEQGRMFALGGEAIAIELLRQDGKEFDNASDDWAFVKDAAPLPVGIDEIVLGQLRGEIYDAQGRFNINNLVPVRGGEPVERAVEQFERLIDILQLDPAIVQAVIDWIDEDTLPRSGGAEDDVYTSRNPPYRTANYFFNSVTELRSVAAIDEDSYAALEPHLTALDPSWCGADGVTPVNINSTSVEVLEAIHEDIDAGQAAAWIEERGETGWEKFDDITDWPTNLLPLVGKEIDIKSQCFETKVYVYIGGTIVSMYSLLDRSGSGDGITTRIRAFGLE